MDSRPPTTADYAAHEARDARKQNERLTARVFLLEAKFNDLEARIAEVESRLATMWKER